MTPFVKPVLHPQKHESSSCADGMRFFMGFKVDHCVALNG